MPRVAAATMPTMSAASRTSRKTMSAVPNMLFRDDHAFGGLLVEFANELVFARLERPDVEGGRRFTGDDLLAVEVVAVEFLGGGVLVLDHQLHLLAGRHGQRVRGEFVVLDHELDLGLARGEGGGAEYEQRG